MRSLCRIGLWAGLLAVVLNDSANAQRGAEPGATPNAALMRRLAIAEMVAAEEQAAAQNPAAERPGAPAKIRVVRVNAAEAAVNDKPDRAQPDKAEPAKAQSDKPGGDQAKPEKGRHPPEIEALTAPLRSLFNRKDAFVNAPLVVMAQPAQARREVGDDDPLTLQMMQQIRPILTDELGFLRTVCNDLVPEQRSKIKAAADLALKEAAKQMANDQLRQRQGVVIVNGVAQAQSNNQASDPLKLIREKLYRETKATLTADQFSRWKKETDSRLDDRKTAAILSVISTIDSHLLLSDEQRRKIHLALRSKWRDEWENWIAVGSTYGHRYVPMVPEECVSGALNEDQQTVWRGLQRINVRNFGLRNRQVDLDDKWWDEAPGKVDAAAGPRL